MKYLLSVLVLTFVASQSCLAQVLQSVDLQPRWTSKDSLQVTLNVSAKSDSLTVPIWAFQFDLEVNPELRFDGVTTVASLSGKEGWTASSNVAKGRVAGFSSSLQAIKTPGVLITLLFVRVASPKHNALCLNELRLNSGEPEADPVRPCIEF